MARTTFAGISDDIEVITFDVSGTLVDKDESWKERTRAVLRANGVEHVSHQAFFGRWRDNLGRVGDAAETTDGYLTTREKLRRSLALTFEEYDIEGDVGTADSVIEGFGDTPIHPETEGVLGALGAEYTLGTITNFDDAMMAACMKRHELAVDYPLNAESLGWRKPDTRIFTAALDEMGYSPDQALHVGSTLRIDMAPTEELGIHNVLVLRSGLPLPGYVADVSPEFIVRDLTALLALLE